MISKTAVTIFFGWRQLKPFIDRAKFNLNSIIYSIKVKSIAWNKTARRQLRSWIIRTQVIYEVMLACTVTEITMPWSLCLFPQSDKHLMEREKRLQKTAATFKKQYIRDSPPTESKPHNDNIGEIHLFQITSCSNLKRWRNNFINFLLLCDAFGTLPPHSSACFLNVGTTDIWLVLWKGHLVSSR